MFFLATADDNIILWLLEIHPTDVKDDFVLIIKRHVFVSLGAMTKL